MEILTKFRRRKKIGRNLDKVQEGKYNFEEIKTKFRRTKYYFEEGGKDIILKF